MSDETEDRNDDPAGLRKRADDALRKLAEAEARAATLERQLLFADAGIPSEGAGKWFRKGYDGELTLEAVKAAADADGLFAAKAPAVEAEAEEPEVPAEEVAALDVMRKTQAGGQLPNSGTPDEQLKAAMANAKSAEELGQILAAAGHRVV